METTRPNNRTRRAMVCAAALGLAAFAHAGGRMPIHAGPERFISHRACVAALETAHVEDVKQASPLTISAGQERHEVTVDSNGVERIGPELARYEVMIWYHNGRLRADLPQPQIETSHSYEHPIRECDGSTMKTSGDRGYTLSTFEPVTAAASPKP